MDHIQAIQIDKPTPTDFDAFLNNIRALEQSIPNGGNEEDVRRFIDSVQEFLNGSFTALMKPTIQHELPGELAMSNPLSRVVEFAQLLSVRAQDPGALKQLAYGDQEIYIQGNPYLLCIKLIMAKLNSLLQEEFGGEVIQTADGETKYDSAEAKASVLRTSIDEIQEAENSLRTLLSGEEKPAA